MIKLHIHKVEHQRKQGEESEKVIAPAVGSKIEQTPEATPVPESNINKRLLLSERTEPKKRNLMFIGLVFTSATLIYVQFLALVFVLNTAPTPPGLIFMVAGLSFIGYLAFKVSNELDYTLFCSILKEFLCHFAGILHEYTSFRAGKPD